MERREEKRIFFTNKAERREGGVSGLKYISLH
jgi:hypothetical protein